MSLRIDVRTPPQLIERAREQQQQQRLAMVERQRQARVRKEAERQVVRERLLTGRNEKGEMVTDGIEMRRREWFGAQAVQQKHRVAVVTEEGYTDYDHDGGTLQYRTREGYLIHTSTGRNPNSNIHNCRLLLPVDGETAILVTGVRDNGRLVASVVYIFNASMARRLGIDGLTLFPYMTRDYNFFPYGISSPTYPGSTLIGNTSTTPYIYEFGQAPQNVLPRVAMVHNSNRTSGASPYTINWYITRKIGQDYGLPDGWYENISYWTGAPLESSAYWKDLQVKLPPVLTMDRPVEYELFIDRRAFYCWDWGQPAYCRQQLLALGFAPEDLVL